MCPRENVADMYSENVIRGCREENWKWERFWEKFFNCHLNNYFAIYLQLVPIDYCLLCFIQIASGFFLQTLHHEEYLCRPFCIWTEYILMFKPLISFKNSNFDLTRTKLNLDVHCIPPSSKVQLVVPVILLWQGWYMY